MTSTLDQPALRADQLRTKSEVARALLGHGSGRALIAASLLLVTARALVGGFGLADALVVALTLVLLGPYEWLIHKFLLHAPSESARMNTLGLGRGHVEHHKDPAEIRWLMLCWIEALGFWALLGLQSAVLSLPIAAAFGASFLATFLTTWTAASLALLHYEWTHLLVHSRYRCRLSYYRALQRHHRLHHYRNEHFWLGVTARSGDRLLSTMPDKQVVALSPTARSLGSS